MEPPVATNRTGRAVLLVAGGVLGVLAMQHAVGTALGRPLLEPISGHAWGWCFALALAWIAAGVGRALLPAGGALARARPEAVLPLRFGVGLAAVTTALVAVGVLWSFDRSAVRAVTVLAAGVAVLGWLRGGRVAVPEERAAAGAPKRWRSRAEALGWAVFALPYLLQTWLPDSDWDSAQYHLPMVGAMLEQGLLSPDYVLAAFYRPANAQVLYAVFFSFGAELGIVPFQVVLVVVGALAVGAIARITGGAGAGRLAIVVYAGINLVLETALDARVEPTLTVYFLLGILAFFAWRSAPDCRGTALLAAWFCGLVAGTKFNGAVYAGLVAVPIAIGVLAHRAWPWRRRIVLAMAGVAVALVPSGVWYARNTAHFGDPFYPFRSVAAYRTADGVVRRIAEPAGELRRDRRAPQELRDEIRDATRQPKERNAARRSPWLLVDALLHRDRYTTKPLHWTSPFVLLFFLLPLLDRRRTAWWLFGIGACGYAALVATTTEIRYFGPLLALLATGSGAVLARARGRWLFAGVAALLVAWLAWLAFEEARKTVRLGPLGYWSGREDRLQYLDRVGYNGAIGMPRIVRWLNARVASGELAPDQRVFMIGEAKGHLLDCRYQPSTSNSGAEWLLEYLAADQDVAKLARSLWDGGYRFVLVNHDWIRWNFTNARVRHRQLAAALHVLREFQSTQAEPPVFRGGFELFRIRAPR